MKTEIKQVSKPVVQSKPKIEVFPPGVHYFYAPDVWFVDTTQTPYIVYIRGTQVKVTPGKFYFYNEIGRAHV